MFVKIRTTDGEAMACDVLDAITETDVFSGVLGFHRDVDPEMLRHTLSILYDSDLLDYEVVFHGVGVDRLWISDGSKPNEQVQDSGVYVTVNTANVDDLHKLVRAWAKSMEITTRFVGAYLFADDALQAAVQALAKAAGWRVCAHAKPDMLYIGATPPLGRMMPEQVELDNRELAVALTSVKADDDYRTQAARRLLDDHQTDVAVAPRASASDKELAPAPEKSSRPVGVMVQLDGTSYEEWRDVTKGGRINKGDAELALSLLTLLVNDAIDIHEKRFGARPTLVSLPAGTVSIDGVRDMLDERGLSPLRQVQPAKSGQVLVAHGKE